MNVCRFRFLNNVHLVKLAVRRWTHRNVGLLGVPLSCGKPLAGTNEGPRVLREAGLIKSLNKLGYDVQDYGDMEFSNIDEDPPSANVKSPRTVGAASKKIRDKVCSVIENNEICLVIGGDHSVTVGSVNGHAMAEPGIVIVWVGANADINTPLSSKSGYLNGMSLSFVVKECERYMPNVAGFEWIKPRIWARDIAYIGLRDVDPGERWFIEQLGITFYSIHDVDRFGINQVFHRALQEVDPTGKRPIHLCYDINALDPKIAQGTGSSVLGGLSVREALYVAEEISSTGRLSAMDLVELNPKLGDDEQQSKTTGIAMQILEHAFGRRRQGMYPAGYVVPIPDKHMRKSSA